MLEPEHVETPSEEPTQTPVESSTAPQSLSTAPPPPPTLLLPPPFPRGDAEHAQTAQSGEHDQDNINRRGLPPMQVDRPAYMMDYVAPYEFASGTLTPTGLAAWRGEIDLDFSAIDLSFLSTYNTQVPFEFENPIGQVPFPGGNLSNQAYARQNDDSTPNSAQGLIHQTLWRFVPVPGNHAYAEQGNLSLPSQDLIVGTPESFADVSRRATSERLDAVARDRVLAILLSQVQSHILPALSAFPSTMLLDKLIQFFLAGPLPTARTWIHTATFRPNKARPELLLAMAAAGAVLTPDRSLRKLGFAMQEVVRNHIPTIFEADNTLVRDLEMVQAFMLQLEIGLWSASSRKIEISESFQTPLLTMLRRGSRFRRSNYPVVAFGPENEGSSLEKKWLAWVGQESFKRIVYHILGHNAEASISLRTNPGISYSELDLPLPVPYEVWSAASAADWKVKYQTMLGSCASRIPSLTECVASPDLLRAFSTAVDLKFSCSSFLYAIWGMVWEYRKLARLLKARPTTTKDNPWDNSLALMTRYQELLKVLDYYRLTYANESTLLLELILLHLHMSLEEIQLFCGLDEVEDDCRAQDSIGEWVDGKMSRLAVWHAGQVVRAARQLPALHLRDFYAITIFHASLTFWAYGFAVRSHPQGGKAPAVDSTHLLASQQQTICVDGEETALTYRYISLNVGTPALRSESAPTPLSNAEAVMGIMIEVMKRGDGDAASSSSPLVENLLNIMGQLKDTGMFKMI
ncbi:hypothetical protein K491DRAFT_772062 [Lophiostoma macrostomum CBS 122681]|uniref:Xylanolytic transcriptional activator regulatory domain-containing protein n=1 Tax=Lophiostoma macrostomum CBS 122681 TaxID=1314788 RepID=A0A6A6SQE7_9PLEO|nr:hypothetical protein K491DRAFT_772062 [Lophiostoma macrostomum CBS 122681]